MHGIRHNRQYVASARAERLASDAAQALAAHDGAYRPLGMPEGNPFLAVAPVMHLLQLR